MICSSASLIVAVGEIKESNSFKKCIVRVETTIKSDEFGDVVQQAETYDCEVAIRNDNTHPELKKLLADKTVFPGIYKLRSFWYEEKSVKKLGKQLILKRWWK